MTQTFKVNERNSNNKSLKENVEKPTKKINVFQIVGMDQIDQMDQMEQRNVVLFCDSRASQQSHPPRACCGAPGECHLVLEYDEILQGSYFVPEFGRGLTIAQR
jgi:hypothetical protein